MHNWTRFSCLIGALILGGCSTNSPSAPDARNAFPSLTKPSELRAAAFADDVQIQQGREFRLDLPNRGFEPLGDWVAIDTGDEGFAFGMYLWDLSEYDEDALLKLQWGTWPAAGKVYLGLANWGADRWDWLQPNPVDLVALPELETYMRSDGTFALAVVVTDPLPTSLQYVSVGHTDPPEDVTIYEVYPLAGFAGDVVQFDMEVSGTSPMYGWNFGAAAMPATSGSKSPTVTLQSPGIYDSSLTVSNRFSTDTLDFSFRINSPSDWSQTLYSSRFRLLALDNQDNLFAAAYYSPHGGLLLSKFTPQGELLWSRHFQLLNFALHPEAMDTDGAGNVYVIAVADTSFEGPAHSVLAKFDPNGNLLWQEYNGINETPQLAVDTAGNAYCTGGEDEGRTVHKIGPDGSVLWSRSLTAEGFALRADCMTCDAANGLVIGSRGIFSARNYEDACISRLDVDGNLSWQKIYGLNAEIESPRACCLLSDGTIAVMLSGLTTSEPSNNYSVLLNVGSDGTFNYARTASGGYLHPEPDPTGGVVVLSFNGIMPFDAAGVPGPIAVYTSDSSHFISDAIVDSSGAVAVCGTANDPSVSLQSAPPTAVAVTLDEIVITGTAEVETATRLPEDPLEVLNYDLPLNVGDIHGTAWLMRVAQLP